MVIYPSARAKPRARAQKKKKFEKKRKKFLTNGKGCAKLNRLTAKAKSTELYLVN